MAGLSTNILVAEHKVKELGLTEGDYYIHKHEGKWEVTIPKRSFGKLLSNQNSAYTRNEKIRRIKNYEENVEGWRPAGMVKEIDGKPTELKPQQQAMIRFALEQGSGIWDAEAGIGKTLALAGLVSELKSQGKNHKACVITKATLRGEFLKEAKKFFPDLKIEVAGGGPESRWAQYHSDADIVLISHDALRGEVSLEMRQERSKGLEKQYTQEAAQGRADIKAVMESAPVEITDPKLREEWARTEYGKTRPMPLTPKEITARVQQEQMEWAGKNTDIEHLKAGNFGMIAIDEAHNLFNPGLAEKGEQKAEAERAKKLRELTAERRILMSGTVVRNDMSELVKQIEWTNPGAIDGHDFLGRYKHVNQGTSAFNKSAIEALRHEIDPYVFTQKYKIQAKLTKDDVSVGLSPEQKAQYGSEERAYVTEKATQGYLGAAPRRDAKHYSTLHNGKWEQNAKVKELLTKLGEKNGEKSVIFTERFNAIDTIKEALEANFGKGCVVTYTGRESNAQREAAKTAFNTGKPRFFLATSAGSTGLNLQGGTQVVNFDVPPSAAEMTQRTARVYRTGQTQDCTSTTLISQTPFDLRRKEIVERKERLISVVNNPGQYDDSGLAQFLTEYDKGKAEKSVNPLSLVFHKAARSLTIFLKGWVPPYLRRKTGKIVSGYNNSVQPATQEVMDQERRRGVKSGYNEDADVKRQLISERRQMLIFIKQIRIKGVFEELLVRRFKLEPKSEDYKTAVTAWYEIQRTLGR
jgi:SNF2 family DNA or RNA helicase